MSRKGWSQGPSEVWADQLGRRLGASVHPFEVQPRAGVPPWCPTPDGGRPGPLPTASSDRVSPAVSQARYVQAKRSVHDRSLKVATVIESLEMEMGLLCLTGVEDQLQADVRPTLETLRDRKSVV